LLMNGTDKFQFIKQYIYAPFPVSSLNLRTLMKLFRTKEPQFVYQTNCGSLCILDLNELIIFKNMNKTGAGMVGDTIPAPVFCPFMAKNPRYFWLFFAEQRARKFCE